MRIRHPSKKLRTRLCDIAGALAALTVLAPLFAVAALLVAVGAGRPIFFRQERIGKGGKPFQILKFRTMEAGGGSAITVSGDHRVTRVGSWLRRFKIDELPQFINVLRGEMSLIGPRPEVREYVEFNDDLWQGVLQTIPGITDLASLVFLHEEEILGPVANPASYYQAVILPQKLRLNLQYQRSRSLARDLKLLWMTARYSFFPHGFDREQVLRSFGG